MKVRDILRRLRVDGWKQVRQKGSHRQFKHDVKSGTVTVAGKPGDELHPKTLASILRQADLESEVHNSTDSDAAQENQPDDERENGIQSDS